MPSTDHLGRCSDKVATPSDRDGRVRHHPRVGCHFLATAGRWWVFSSLFLPAGTRSGHHGAIILILLPCHTTSAESTRPLVQRTVRDASQTAGQAFAAWPESSSYGQYRMAHRRVVASKGSSYVGCRFWRSVALLRGERARTGRERGKHLPHGYQYSVIHT